MDVGVRVESTFSAWGIDPLRIDLVETRVQYVGEYGVGVDGHRIEIPMVKYRVFEWR